jgi:GMP synthase (glutamine-hydrolysing)
VSDTSPLLVVQHQDDCPPALFADWLGEAGMPLDVRRPDRGDALPVDLGGHAGVVVLGGSMGAHDDVQHPWLPTTKALLRHAVAVEAPALGICLGHQLAAVALGGASKPNAGGQTVGVRPIGWLGDDMTRDPLFGPLAETDARVVHWNSDIVTELPDGVAVLARTDDGAAQVLRFGPRSWGVQFHPEVDHAVLAPWAEEDRAKPDSRVDVDGALLEVKESETGLFATGRLLAHTFADVVTGRR